MLQRDELSHRQVNAVLVLVGDFQVLGHTPVDSIDVLLYSGDGVQWQGVSDGPHYR